MNEREPPKIEFPCENYPIKVMGLASEAYRESVLNVMEKYAPGFDAGRIQVKPSKAGKYESVTVFITATGIAQLEAIFEDLKKLPETRMVL